MKNLIYISILLLSLGSCTKKLDMNAMSKTHWMLKTWTGNKFVEQGIPTLMFDEANSFSGKSFCNSYGGNLILTEKSLKFDKVFSTKMYCKESNDLEAKYLKELAEVDFAKIEKGQLYLYRDDELIMTFAQPL